MPFGMFILFVKSQALTPAVHINQKGEVVNTVTVFKQKFVAVKAGYFGICPDIYLGVFLRRTWLPSCGFFFQYMQNVRQWLPRDAGLL